jgi:membrane protein DedA with SNARE-associated domain/membrane-associated phospholipid phosphatase
MMFAMHVAIRLLDFVSSIKAIWTYGLIFVSSYAEGLPFVGLVSPGGIFTVLGGFLSKVGNLNLFYTFSLAVAGAILGDVTGYFLGKHYGYDFIKKYGRFFFLKEEHRIQKTRALIAEHPAKAIILGRFYYLTRSISPFLAGTSAVSFWAFLWYDFLGSIIWASAHVFGGFLFGRGFELLSRYINYVLIIATILCAGVFILYRVINKRHHIFKKYHVYTMMLNIVSIYVFAQTVVDVVSYSTLYRADRLVESHIHLLWSPVGIALMTLVTNIGGVYGATSISILALGILLWKKRWYYSILFSLSMFSGLVSEFIIKYDMQLPRPPHSLVPTDYYSFPSGHATMITILGSLIFLCFKGNIRTLWGRRILFSSVATMIVGVCFSRIYLNAHWTSDVIAGLALGFFWVTFYILAIRVIVLTDGKPLSYLRKLARRHTVNLHYETTP